MNLPRKTDWLPALALIGILAVGQATAAPAADPPGKAVVAAIEKAILQASEWQEKGKIQKGRPLMIPVASDLRLTFTAENFNADLDKAFQILDQYMSRTGMGNEPVPKTAPPPLAARSAPPAPPPSPSPQGRAADKDRLTALREAERQTQSLPSAQSAAMSPDFSVYGAYRQNHQRRRQEQEKTIEAEKQMVIAERQAAAQNQLRKRERDQQLQSQSGAWQTELDRQAKASAAVALQWEQENSFGAHMKRFLGMVVQTSVGAFTGGFLGTVSTNLANKAVSKLFPDANASLATQATAAGTSAAITQTGTTVGQTVGQQAAAQVVGQGSGTAQSSATMSSGTGTIPYTPPKY